MFGQNKTSRCQNRKARPTYDQDKLDFVIQLRGFARFDNGITRPNDGIGKLIEENGFLPT
jgi:hypothetical protein